MRTFTQSLSMIVPAAMRDKCNRLMMGLDRDNLPDPGNTFSVELAPNQATPVTHYGAHTWDDDLAAILDAGVLPEGIDWGTFNLTTNEANQALAIIKHFAVVNEMPSANFSQKVAAEGLERLWPEEDP